MRYLRLIIFNLLTNSKWPLSLISKKLVNKTNFISYIDDKHSIKELLLGNSRDEITQIKKLVEKKNLKNSIFIDVGANIGIFSYYLSFFKRIHSIEPNKKVFRILELNVLKFKNINIHNIALGEKNSHVYLRNSVNNISSNKVYLKKKFNDEKVKSSRLDTFLKRQKINNSKVKIIKVDVEGNELMVFKGAKNFLKKHSPYLFFELECINNINFYSHKVIKFLKKFGYVNFYIIEKKFNLKNYFKIVEKNRKFSHTIHQVLASKNKI